MGTGAAAMNFDRRITPARTDLAALHLKGQVEAERYVSPARQRIRMPVAPLRPAPDPGCSLDTEALFGETVDVYEVDAEGWAWGQLTRDGYVGYLPAEALHPATPAATHRISVPRGLLFAAPDIKHPAPLALSFGSLLTVNRIEGEFAATAEGFVRLAHLAPVSELATDHLAVARRFLDTPYLWGGRSGFGIDCSGLVQMALTACGMACPRDSDMQEAQLGQRIDFDPADPAAACRTGDFIFWKGHVGIVSGPDQLLHANAHHMRVVEEPLGGAIARIAGKGLPVRTLRRLGVTA